MGAEYAELGAAGGESEEKVADAVASARCYFTAGLQQCPGCIPLWRLSCRFEERHSGPNRARSTIELARLRVPKCDELWLEATRLERRAGNAKVCGEWRLWVSVQILYTDKVNSFSCLSSGSSQYHGPCHI